MQLELAVISTKWSEAERVEKSPSATQHCFLSGRFLGYSLREFGLRRPLEMTYRGKAPLKTTHNGKSPTMRHNSTLAFQPVGACIASPLCRRCFPVRVLIKSKRLVQHPRRTRNARPYAEV